MEIQTLSLSVILTSLTLLLSSLLTLSELCDPNDKKALLQIKKAFNDPSALSTWSPESDCCTDWFSVTCHRETNRINSLIISGGLSSAVQIPPEIADLDRLENLVLIKHKTLTGPIPPAISRLRSLAYLTISWTAVSGRIPAALCRTKSLRSLDLSFNHLSGEIPPCLAGLPSLGSLHLDRNNFSGEIPNSFGAFPGEDFYLYLSHNRLSGRVPASLAAKKDFVAVDLSWNGLAGDASGLFSLPSLERLDLSRNSLEFDLSKVGKLPRGLTWLDLSHNRIFGALPTDLTGLNLVMFNVSYNRLCGRIPTGGVLQTRFGVAEYSNNQCLCGAPLNVSC